jgi:hypothetical protein
VARELPQPLRFDDVWVAGLQRVEDGEYVYAVTQLDLSHRDAPTWLVRIRPDFEGWRVTRFQ